MKRLFVGLMVIALMAVAASPGIAQNKGGSLQVFGGANIAKQSASGATGSEFTTGFMAGGAFTYRLSPRFGLGLGVDYAQAGTGDSATTLVGTKIDYLYIAANFSVYMPIPNSPILPWVYGGLAYGITLSCEGSLFSTFPSQTDCKDNVSNDLAAQFGAGLSFGLGAAGALFIGGAYRFSLQAIDDIPNETLNVKNQQIQLFGGYSFRFYSTGL